MIQKAISLFMAVTTLSVYLWSQLQPSDALFLFASANMLINLGLVGLAILMVRLSFADRFKKSWTYTLAVGGAVGCLVISAAGIISAGLAYQLYTVFGPLDFVILTEAGIVLSICALSYKHPSRLQMPSLKMPHFPLPKPALMVAKIPASSLKHAASAK